MNVIPSEKALIIYQTVDTVFVGVSAQTYILASGKIPHRDASKELIPCIDSILIRLGLTLQDMTYIACTIGPASFTTLRTLVVTSNGLGFATGIPLIGINGIELLAKVTHSERYIRTYAISNAFSHDVYLAYYSPEEIGDCTTITWEEAMSTIALFCDLNVHGKVQLVGNASHRCHELLQRQGIMNSACANNDHVSLEIMAHEAHGLWVSHHSKDELTPYYGKMISCVE